MAPPWAGVNYGAKGFAKTICLDESTGKKSKNLFWGGKKGENEKLSNSPQNG